MFVEIFQNSSLVESLAWTLLHSVWQIGLVAFLLLIALKFVSRSNANLRYFISVSTLSLALILPIFTFSYVSNFPFYANNKQVISANASEKLQQEQFENSEEFLANGNLANEIKGLEKTSSINNWQNSLKQTFSDYSPLLVAFWFVGILLFSLRLFGGFWQLHKVKTREVSKANYDWQRRFSDICEKLNIKQKVKLLRSNLVESPMVIGWIKPVILIPASVFLQMNPTQLETIIAHELMHIKRFDYLVNFAQSFVEILFFYHPCVWWISAKIRQERECACDDAVLLTLENAQFTYANALANLETFRNSARQNEPQFNIAANGGKLMNRIERIVKKETKRSKVQNSLWSASLASMLILAFFVTIFWANSSSDVNQKPNWNYNSERRMAVGFVSIPPNFKEDIDENFDETAKLLITKLEQNNVPAVGFVTGSKILNNNIVSKFNMDIVRMWRDAGLEVGVGGYRHMRFYDSDYKNYVVNTENNIKIVKPILAEKGQDIKYFSYPYLNTGKDIESKVRFEKWLSKNNLRFIPYTFDNQEWLYSYAYDVARKENNSEMMIQIKQEFLDYMQKMVVHFEGYSNDLFAREIPQTLVLTTSRLVADSADELFGMFARRGYEFVSMDVALNDEAYNQSETFVGRAGISWMERWSMTRGKKLRTEPKVAEEVNKVWESRNLQDGVNPPPPTAPVPPVVSITPPPPPPKPPKPSKPPKPPKDAPVAPPAPPAPPANVPSPPPPPPAPPRF